MRSDRSRALARALSAATLAMVMTMSARMQLTATASVPERGRVRRDSIASPLVISSAVSLAGSVTDLAAALRATHPGIEARQSSGGSVAAARRAMDSATVPDVLAVADVAILPRLLMPRHATWHAAFARSAMVLVYTARSAHAREITAANGADVLLRPGVRAGHADPALDPGGYRARLVFQLAERHYARPGLAARLDAAVPTVTPAAGDNLIAMLERGALDYLLVYRTTARERGLRAIELPAEVNLSDPRLASRYAWARIRVAAPGARDSLEVRGEPILYGVTIPRAARHPETATAFVRLLLSPAGRDVLRRHGFEPLARPAFGGSPPREIATAGR